MLGGIEFSRFVFGNSVWIERFNADKQFADDDVWAKAANVGFDFLGDALASATHKTYTQLLKEHIVQPLGLRDTTVTPSREQCARLLRGTGDEGLCTDTQASAPSGGVYSTSADMVRVLQYLLHIPGVSAQADPAIAVYLKPTQLKSVNGLSHAGDPTGIGLGWVQLGDPNGPSALMEKTGL